MIRRMPKMSGRIQSVDITPDGKLFAAGSGLDGKGQLQVYRYDFDSMLTKELKTILSKVEGSRSAAERKKREAFVTRNIKQISSLDLDTGVYSISFSPDGKFIACGGVDGRIRFVETDTGIVTANFVPVEVANPEALTSANALSLLPSQKVVPPKQLSAKIASITVEPKQIRFTAPTDYTQLKVTATQTDGSDWAL